MSLKNNIFLSVLSVVLASTAIAGTGDVGAASKPNSLTGAQKFMRNISTRSYAMELTGEDCYLAVSYDTVTQMSQGRGPINLDGIIANKTYTVRGYMDIDLVPAVGNEVVIQYREGLMSGSDIVIQVDDNGKPLSAAGSARVGLRTGDVQCTFTKWLGYEE